MRRGNSTQHACLIALVATSLAACKDAASRPHHPGSPDATTVEPTDADAAFPTLDATIDTDGLPSSPDVSAPDRPASDLATPGDDPALPLSTCGRWIVGSTGRRVKLAGANWYGASDTKLVVGGLDKVTLASVASRLRALGFNSVRLPFSNEMLTSAASVADAVAANPELKPKTALQIFDATVDALTRAGLLVILNNHSTHAMWCCNYDDDGLWYTREHSEEQWLADWEMVAQRYAANPLVVGADLRNEIRIAKPVSGLLPRVPSWGGGGANDWRAAAIRAADRIHAKVPHWLIVVEGLNSAEDLTDVGGNPIVLKASNKLVYSSHQYGFFRPGLPAIPGTALGTYGAMDAGQLKSTTVRQWGYLTNPGQPYTAPVWLGEFGDSADADPRWLTNLAGYLRDTDLDWAYWAVNAGPKASGDPEPYGLLEDDWTTVRTDWRLPLLKSLISPTQGPGLTTPVCLPP